MWSTRIDLGLTEILAVADKDIKTVILTVSHMFKKLEERMNMLNRENIKTQIELIEMKIAKSKMKNTLDGINRLDPAEEKISDFEAIAIETIQEAVQGE